MCNKFVLKTFNNAPDKFFIEMPYGDFRPRLTIYDRDFLMKSDITCSTMPNLPDKLSVWTI